MSEKSPNELALESLPGVSRFSRWPVYACIAGAALLLGILFHSMSSERDPEPRQPISPATTDEKPLVPEDAGRGLATHQPPKAKEPDERKEDEALPSITVVQAAKDAAPEYQRELEQLRRHKLQGRISALASPLTIRRPGASDSVAARPASADVPPSRGTVRNDALADMRQMQDGSYNPAADRDKEAFYSRARRGDHEWMSANARMDGQPLELKTGAVIPAIMLTGVNSDLPGSIIAQVAMNVFDAVHGRHLLVPRGSRLFGVYDSRMVYGQERVLLAWNRIVFPDGSAMTLDAMPGADMAGYSGFNDQVNNHYLRVFGTATLMSLITGGMAWGVDSMTPNSAGALNNSNAPSLQQQMGTALASQLGQTAAQMLTQNLNIKPTLEIRPGYRFNIVVTKDMVFEAPYVHKR